MCYSNEGNSVGEVCVLLDGGGVVPVYLGLGR